MFSPMDPANSTASCNTVPAILRRAAAPIPRTATPSTSTSPSVGVRMPSRMLIRVGLPPPDGPVMATDSPGSMRRLMPSSTYGS
ncbi:hypothetical protein G6F32_017315 [Rhizopus arrhizus]|nr:hypothetical protein G6F32_017315 [Rhizopus arrhizus]